MVDLEVPLPPGKGRFYVPAQLVDQGDLFGYEKPRIYWVSVYSGNCCETGRDYHLRYGPRKSHQPQRLQFYQNVICSFRRGNVNTLYPLDASA